MFTKHELHLQQVKDLYGGLADDLKEVVDILTMAPDSNTHMWSIINMAFHIILPIGLMIAAAFAMMTILEKTILFKTHNIESVAKMLLLFVFGKVLLENSFEIMGWLYQIVAELIFDMGTVPNIGMSDTDLDALASALDAMGPMELFWSELSMLPCSIIMWLLKLAVKIIAYGRLFELYIYMAVAPIPLSSLVSETHAGIAKRFLQGYLAACLQGLIMLLSIMLYSALETQLRYSVDVNGMLTGDMGFLLPTLMLCLVLMKSGSWAKTVTGLI